MSYQDGLKLFTNTKRLGLEGNNSSVYFTPNQRNQYINSIHTCRPQKCDSSSSESSMSWLVDLTSVLSLAMTGFGLFKSIKDLFGAAKDLKDPNGSPNTNPNPDAGAGANGSSDTIQLTNNIASEISKANHTGDWSKVESLETDAKNKVSANTTKIKELQGQIDSLDKEIGSFETDNNVTIPKEKQAAETTKTQAYATAETAHNNAITAANQLQDPTAKSQAILEADKAFAKAKANADAIYKDTCNQLDVREKANDKEITKKNQEKGKINEELTKLQKENNKLQVQLNNAADALDLGNRRTPEVTTEEQKKLANVLGVDLTNVKTKAEAEKLIQASQLYQDAVKIGLDPKNFQTQSELKDAIQKNKPTDEQVKLATVLGIDINGKNKDALNNAINSNELYREAKTNGVDPAQYSTKDSLQAAVTLAKKVNLICDQVKAIANNIKISFNPEILGKARDGYIDRVQELLKENNLTSEQRKKLEDALNTLNRTQQNN